MPSRRPTAASAGSTRAYRGAHVRRCPACGRRGAAACSLLRPTSTQSGDHTKRAHHLVVFMFDDVAVVDVLLWCCHTAWKVEASADNGELSGVRFGGVLVAALLL